MDYILISFNAHWNIIKKQFDMVQISKKYWANRKSYDAYPFFLSFVALSSCIGIFKYCYATLIIRVIYRVLKVHFNALLVVNMIYILSFCIKTNIVYLTKCINGFHNRENIRHMIVIRYCFVKIWIMIHLGYDYVYLSADVHVYNTKDDTEVCLYISTYHNILFLQHTLKL